MTKTTAPLQWINSNGILWRTPLDAEGCRFLIHREVGSSLTPRFMLERVHHTPRSRKTTVLRQLRGIQGIQEAMRIAQEDWS
jgi:hypothetical protein